MLFLGDPTGIHFKYKNLLCILNNKFNMVLFVENTLVETDSLNLDNQVGFVIPIKYLSFIKTLNKKYSYTTKISTIFEFKSAADEKRLQEYINLQINDLDFEIVKDLAPGLRQKM